MQKLGERIKKRREYLEVSLNVLAKNVGISSSMLSQIENGKAYPSIHNLKNIADALNTTLGSLVGENETFTNNPVVKFNEKKFVKQTEFGASLYLLAHYSPMQNMEIYMISFEANGHAEGLMENIRHAQEFCHVINGVAEINLEGKIYTLKQGDSIYFDSTSLLSIKNTSKNVSEILWVISPYKQ